MAGSNSPEESGGVDQHTVLTDFTAQNYQTVAQVLLFNLTVKRH
jgi:hypothetical protein